MKTERFTAVLLEGHKENAVEVPFDPAARWRLPATRLWLGRHGHRVQGRLNGFAMDSAIVARAGGFYLVIADELKQAAGLAVGDTVQVTLHPQAPGATQRPASPTRRRTPRSTTPG